MPPKKNLSKQRQSSRRVSSEHLPIYGTFTLTQKSLLPKRFGSHSLISCLKYKGLSRKILYRLKLIFSTSCLDCVAWRDMMLIMTLKTLLMHWRKSLKKPTNLRAQKSTHLSSKKKISSTKILSEGSKSLSEL
jgi:hypothetical protein